MNESLMILNAFSFDMFSGLVQPCSSDQPGYQGEAVASLQQPHQPDICSSRNDQLGRRNRAFLYHPDQVRQECLRCNTGKSVCGTAWWKQAEPQLLWT